MRNYRSRGRVNKEQNIVHNHISDRVLNNKNAQLRTIR